MIAAQAIQKRLVIRAEFIWRFKLRMNKLMLPVRIKEAAIRIITEWLSGQMIQQRLHDISLYDTGDPRVVINQKLPLKLLFKRIGGNSQLTGKIVLP